MTLRHLKIFVTVCETGSITSAGEKLYLAQPSVSLAISELEKNYGIKLFDRISQRLYITETGKHFLQYATHIVALFEEMENSVRNLDAIGLLRIGTSITIGNYLLPNYVKAFEEIHPQMKIQVVIDNSDTIEEKILKNEIDIGLIEGVVHSPYIESKIFMEDELIFICGYNHPFAKFDEIELDMLKDSNFILREKGSGGREILESIFILNGIEIQPTWQSVSTQAIVRAVSKGLGVSVLPYLLVKENLDKNEIKHIQIKNISLKRNLLVIYHKNKYLGKSTEDFIDLCK